MDLLPITLLTSDSFDLCLFICPDYIIVLYIDDAIIVGQNQPIVEAFVLQLEADMLDLTRKGTLAHYLGVTRTIPGT
jgi:hypothetical protein